MTPYYLSEFSTIPLMEGDHDHQTSLQAFTLPAGHPSSVFYPVLFSTPQVQGPRVIDQQVQQQHELNDHLMIQGSAADHPASFSTNNTAERSVVSTNQYNQEEDHHQSGKWMSSKMRFMRKMMSSEGLAMAKPRRSAQLPQDQRHEPTQESSGGAIIRVCSDCNTTKTPLWRSGPSGPKSLCNACGIRQRKARRAMAALSNGGLVPEVTQTRVRKEKGSDVDRTVPFKKRCRFFAPRAAQKNNSNKKKRIGFDDIVISLSKSSAFHRVFPQDEKDAAILLMALSCGLICS